MLFHRHDAGDGVRAKELLDLLERPPRAPQQAVQDPFARPHVLMVQISRHAQVARTVSEVPQVVLGMRWHPGRLGELPQRNIDELPAVLGVDAGSLEQNLDSLHHALLPPSHRIGGRVLLKVPQDPRVLRHPLPFQFSDDVLQRRGSSSPAGVAMSVPDGRGRLDVVLVVREESPLADSSERSAGGCLSPTSVTRRWRRLRGPGRWP
jgi:hypothetical protein